MASTLGVLNPFRYRGYVYDEETQWYYLQSRYYNPEVGRFISADVLLSTGQGVIGHNTYAYCRSNFATRKDALGYDDENAVNDETDVDDVEDITDLLNQLMDDHVHEMKTYQYWVRKSLSMSETDSSKSEAIVWLSTLSYFFAKVNDKGDWDLKLTTTTFSYEKKNLLYDGNVYTGEQIGNIHFGYVGRALYSKTFLHFGAGLNQASKKLIIDYWPYFFDEPEDYAMVELGAKLYEARYLNK